jgi:DNA adenine methylase
LSGIKGKFLLSSYPSPILKRFTKKYGWQKWSINQKISVNAKGGNQKTKTEVLVANYPIGQQLAVQLTIPEINDNE